jgi:hypothetical protein
MMGDCLFKVPSLILQEEYFNHYFKPFKVGHTIEAQIFATVSDIQIFL